MNLEEKLKVFETLQSLNVDIVEAGFAIVSEGDFEAVKEVSKLAKNTIVCSLARSNKADIERANEALSFAERFRIHTFIATSDLHMKYKLQMTRDEVIQQIKTVSVMLEISLMMLNGVLKMVQEVTLNFYVNV